MADSHLLPPAARGAALAFGLRFSRKPPATTTDVRIEPAPRHGREPSAATGSTSQQHHHGGGGRVIRVSVASALVAMVAVQGCAATSDVASVPPPSFNGPTVATPAPARPAQQPKPAAPPPAPVAAKPKGPTQSGPRDWAAKAPARPWKWIVIHHSATPAGNAAEFDKIHKSKGWDELGYHFVIGNGTNSANGQIEVGPRWPKQKYGAHAKTADNQFNENGIGICLVGNFDLERPTPQQLQSLARLTSYLMKTYNVPPDRVIGHGDTKATECPGRFMSIVQVRRMATQALANAGEPVGVDASAGEYIAAGADGTIELLGSEPAQ